VCAHGSGKSESKCSSSCIGKWYPHSTAQHIHHRACGLGLARTPGSAALLSVASTTRSNRATAADWPFSSTTRANRGSFLGRHSGLSGLSSSLFAPLSPVWLGLGLHGWRGNECRLG
jgi:hypothetical protein